MVFEAKLVIKALGGCSVAYEDRIISDETMGSKKFWTALEYLVLHRDRPVTQAELINVLYREGESFNPGNALKTLIHRIRESLSTLQYIDGRKIILNVRGAYKWNTKIEYEYDLEHFENLVKKLDAQPLSEDERLDISLSALDAYDGSCLPKFKQEDWAQEVIEKYNSMFKRTLLSTIELLKKRSDYEKIVSLCRHAINLDPYDESLYYHVIDGLVVLGDNESALREYNRMSDLFYKQYGISPSIELRKIYREIKKTEKNVETDLSIIQEDLSEESEPNGAYFCEYEIFKDIYRLEVRSSSRRGEVVHLGHITLEIKQGADPSLKSLNYYMDKLNECICSSLRRGDVFSKYSISQFITLLPTNTYDSAMSVMERIAKKFHRENPRAPFSTGFSVRSKQLAIG